LPSSRCHHLPDTIRFNLDPESKMRSANEMDDILRQAKLWEFIAKKGGLDATIDAGTLSLGEQQLLALGRAVLRKRCSTAERDILILDEATSSLDSASEAAIHEVISKEFGHNTVISVAHRLEVLKDVDVVLLLENGRVAKTGLPEMVINGN